MKNEVSNFYKTIAKIATITFILALTNITFAQSSVDFLEKVQQYKDKVKIIKKNPDILDSATYNTNEYFNLYDKLSLANNLEIHTIFDDVGTAGIPCIYVKDKSFDLKKHIEDQLSEEFEDINKITKKNIENWKYFLLGKYAYKNQARNFVIPQDSEIGYLQYLFFHRLGEYFAYKWHAAFFQTYIIYSKEHFIRFYDFYQKEEDFICDLDELKKLTNIDTTPVITMDNENCYITWIEIATHQWIKKNSFKISRSYPYNIEKTDEVELLKIVANFLY